MTKSVWFSKFHGSKCPIVVFDFQTMEMWSLLRTTIWHMAHICNTECAGGAVWWQPEVDVCHFFCDLVLIRRKFHTNVVPSQDTVEGNHRNWHDFFLLFYKLLVSQITNSKPAPLLVSLCSYVVPKFFPFLDENAISLIAFGIKAF